MKAAKATEMEHSTGHKHFSLFSSSPSSKQDQKKPSTRRNSWHSVKRTSRTWFGRGRSRSLSKHSQDLAAFDDEDSLHRREAASFNVAEDTVLSKNRLPSESSSRDSEPRKSKDDTPVSSGWSKIKHLSFRDHSARPPNYDKDEEAANKSKHRSERIPRKPSKLKIIFGKSERPQFVIMTDEMIRLETIIQSDKGRHRLVQELLSMPGDYSVKVRFCSAVDTFDSASDEHDRNMLAQSLVNTFLTHGCLFYINSLSEGRYHSIVTEGKYNQLLNAKREVLEELASNAEVMSKVEYIESLDNK